MRNIAGCSPAVSSYGTSLTGTTAGSAGDGTQATQFSGTCAVGVNSPRQAVGDQWENIYFADNSNSRIRVVLGVASITVNGSPVANPLYTALATSTGTGLNYSTPVQGYIYPIAGGGTACSGKTDAGGNGCPFYQTVVGSSTVVQGLAVMPEGDFIFDDGLGRLRTIYMGGTVIKSALTANGVTSPQIGYSYALIGNGNGTSGASSGTFLYYNTASLGYTLGKNDSLQSSIQRLAVDAAGNIYIGDQAQVLFYDIYTGYVHRLGGATTATSCNTSTVGDGCPVTQSLFGAANSVLSVAIDTIGDLYIQDLTNKTIRRVAASLLPTAAVSSSHTSNIVVHAPVAASSISVSTASGSDYTVATPSCATTAADGSNECTATATYAPTLLAQRTVPISVATTVGTTTTTVNSTLASIATGSALVFDTTGTPSTTTLGATATGNTALVMDGFGNQYVSGTQGISKISGSTVTTISGTATTYIAVDPQGNVYAANAGASSLTKYSYSATANAYTTGSVAIPLVSINGAAATQGYSGPMVVDAFGTVFIADTTNKHLIKFTQGALGIAQQITQTALGAPSAMTMDVYGNLLIVDGTSVLKVPPAGFTVNASSPVTNPKVTFQTALVAPTAVAADQGGNIYVADSGNIIALPYTGYQYTIPNITGSAVAVDGAGNLYTTISSVAGVTKIVRNAESHDFGTDVVTPYVGVFSNAGGTAGTGFNQTDTGGNYSFLAPSSPLSSAPTCAIGTTAIASGSACNISITFAPTAVGSGAVPDVITALPTPTLGSLSLNGTKNGSTATTTTGITGNTSGLIYSTGTEATFTVTVTQSTGTPSGVVAVQIDGGTAVNYTLTSGSGSTATATVTVSGLSATSHTIVANYPSSAGIAGSTSSTVNFSISPASTSVSWTPSSFVQPVSQAIGTGVLDAISVGSIPGAFTYTATPSGGSAQGIDASTYLAIGTYALGVTFIPTDSVNYTSSTGSVATYVVQQASTTAPVGASQYVVATDGSGNYGTVQAAVNAVGASGGSIYIKPGTYAGMITVVQPNVALRGLGGDATKVILTHASGAFSVSPGTGYNYAGEFNSSYSNGSQLPSGSSVFNGDQGSSTMVVAGATNTAVSSSSLVPTNFYAENLTVNNTYNTDTTTTTTTYLSGGICSANAGTAQTYSYLYNNGIECASQALAIFTTSDQSIMNNVYTASGQDTVYAGSGGCGLPCTVARQYWWRGKIAGVVDYIFGDAAAVFDHDNIFTGYRSPSTVEAQSKHAQTGSTADYLSGYVFNNSTFTSQQTGMSNLYLGRPWGTYSTMVLINAYIDQLNPLGWEEFSGTTNLPTSTYVEYNTHAYTDPAPGSADINGVIYTGTGGNTGSGAIGTRETTSQNPGTAMASNAVKTAMTAAQAAAYYPIAFLGTKIGPGGIGTLSQGAGATWNPVTALANGMNAFVPSGSTVTVNAGTSITILMRPQTPGGGVLPTGTYTLKDGSTTLASGTLDASGEAYYTTNSLSAGSHSITWVYGGDTNFTGSTTTTPLSVTVTGGPFSSTTVLQVNNSSPTYGTAVTGTVTVTPSSGSGNPSGVVSILLGSTPVGNCTLVYGSCSFSIAGIAAGSPSLTASYPGDANYNSSQSSASSLSVGKATLTLTATSSSRTYGQPNSLGYTLTGFVYSDTQANATTGSPTITTTATQTSAAGTYPITAAAGSLAATNYSFTAVGGTLTVNSGAVQKIFFPALPNLPIGGPYELTARTNAGQTITYSITTGSGLASVSGPVLTVTGAGTITVTTNAASINGFNAASSVSRTFTSH
ncbi:MAG: pectinesterase family protein [Acidobacteriaceae bacterium]|nr:pectinesterase family protein [Acidobacteriaceae bacterium]